MKKINKLLLTLFSFILCFLFSSFIVKADFVQSGMAYYVSTQFGEDASTMMGISYQSERQDTYVMYTLATDTEFANAVKVNPVCTLIDFSVPVTTRVTTDLIEYKNFPETGYDCEVNLTNLTPDTKYIYYITDGINKTDVYTFKTGPVDGSRSFTFAYFNDTQLYGAQSTTNSKYKYYMHLCDQMFTLGNKNNTPVEFIWGGGDMVEHGGDGEYWGLLYNNDHFKEVPFMSCIGNHEYTNCLISSSTLDGRFYASTFNNPKNGCETVYPETTFYYTYGDTLFIALGSSENKEAQIKWLDNVLANNKCQWVVACVHANPQGTNQAATSREFAPTFDKYGVDLVMFGDEHVYKTYDGYYNYKKVSSGSSTFYMEMYAVAGMTSVTTKGMESLVTINDEHITIRIYDYEGNKIYEKILNSKRPVKGTTYEFDKEVFEESLESDVVDQTKRTSLNLYWDNCAYGNVKSISVLDSQDKELASGAVFSTVYNYLTISGLVKDRLYDVKVNYELYNGETYTTNLTLSTFKSDYGTISNFKQEEKDAGLKMTYVPELTDDVTSFKLYVNGKLYDSYKKGTRGITVSYDAFTSGKNTIKLYGLVENDREILLQKTTYNYENYNITYNCDGNILGEYVTSFKDSSTVTLPICTKEGYDFVGWSSEGNIIETLDNKNYELTAVFKKYYNIEYNYDLGDFEKKVKFYENDEVTLPVLTKEGYTFDGWFDGDEKVTEISNKDYTLTPKFTKVEEKTNEPVDNDTKSKSGCKNAMILINGCIMLLGVIVLRRKKFN